MGGDRVPHSAGTTCSRRRSSPTVVPKRCFQGTHSIEHEGGRSSRDHGGPRLGTRSPRGGEAYLRPDGQRDHRGRDKIRQCHKGRPREGRKKKKKKVNHRERRWWKNFTELIVSRLYVMRVKKGRNEKESKRSERRTKARQTLEKFGKWLFLLLILGQNWLCASAAAEGPQRRTDAMVMMQQEVQVKESRWAEEIPQRWNQPQGESRTEMEKRQSC